MSLRKKFLPIFWILLGFAILACVPTPPKPTPSSTRQNLIHLKILVSPENSAALIDGIFYGHVNQWQDHIIPLPPGEHRLELKAQGYYIFRKDLNLKANRSYTLKIEMIPQYDQLARRSWPEDQALLSFSTSP